MKLVIIMFMNTAKFSEPKITDFFRMGYDSARNLRCNRRNL